MKKLFLSLIALLVAIIAQAQNPPITYTTTAGGVVQAGTNVTVVTNGSVFTVSSTAVSTSSTTVTNANPSQFTFDGVPAYLSLKNGAYVTNLINKGEFTLAADPLNPGTPHFDFNVGGIVMDNNDFMHAKRFYALSTEMFDPNQLVWREWVLTNGGSSSMTVYSTNIVGGVVGSITNGQAEVVLRALVANNGSVALPWVALMLTHTNGTGDFDSSVALRTETNELRVVSAVADVPAVLVAASVRADLAATTNNLFSWVSSEAFQATNSIVDSDGVIQTSGVIWPDGSAGLFTNTRTNTTWSTVDGFTITHAGTGWTVVQAAVSRGPLGVVTNKPALTIQ